MHQTPQPRGAWRRRRHVGACVGSELLQGHLLAWGPQGFLAPAPTEGSSAAVSNERMGTRTCCVCFWMHF